MSLYNTAGQLTSTRAYHSIPTSGDGSAGTNYAIGRQNKSSDVEAACMSPTDAVA